MPRADELSPAEMDEYRQAARSRTRQRKRELVARQERGWCAARQAARLLKERFGAHRVVVFGSLARPGNFTHWSDVDVAAWGLAPTDTFRAMSAVADVDRQMRVNLVDVATCRADLRAVIEQEGVDL